MTFKRRCFFFLLILLCIGSASGLGAVGVPDSLRRRIESLDAQSALIFANKYAGEDHSAAFFAFDVAFRKALGQNDTRLIFSIFRDKGIFWEDLKQLDSALTHYRHAFDIAEKNGLAADARVVLNDLAIASRKKERFQDSRDFHLQAIARARRADDDEMLEFSLHGLGFLYEMVGDRELALKYYQESYEAAKKRGHKNGMMVTLGNIAAMLASGGSDKAAVEQLDFALDLAETSRDTEQTASLLFLKGDILFQANRLAEASKSFQAALPWCQMAKQWDSEARCRLYLGQIAEKEGDHERAWQWFRDCFLHPQSLPPDLLTEINLSCGHLAMKFQNLPEAFRFFKNAHDVASENHFSELEAQASDALSQWYRAANDPANALKFLERANRLQDSLSQAKREKGSLELDFRYDLEKNARALEAADIRASRWRTFFVLLLGLVVAGAMGYWVHVRKTATKRLRAKNEAIREQNARLEESNSFLHQFTYAVAHDLKEPLRTISSFITLLEKKHGHHFTGDGIQFMSYVQTGVRRMHALISDLLAFSNISSQRPGGEKANSKIVLDKITHQLKTEIHSKNASISYPTDMPPVRMNPTHLGHLFHNMIHNGLKFNDNQHPEIKISAERQNGHVVFSIEDNGIGIDREHGKKIYDLFHQLHKNKSYGGTGIGLTVVKNIVDKYDGAISFESAEGAGTRFFVSLPAG